MDKFAFNHDEENLAIALGIGDDRADQIIKIARIAHINSKNNLDMFEETINQVDPKKLCRSHVCRVLYCEGS